MSQNEIEDKYDVNKNINLVGFTSSTLNKKEALSFTLDDKNPLIPNP